MALLTWRPINFYKRDKEFYAAIADGSLTSRRMLEIEYSEYPMRGIEIANDNSEPVNVKGIWQDKRAGFFAKIWNSLTTAGYVYSNQDKKNDATNTLYMNRFLYSPLGQYTLLKVPHWKAIKALVVLSAKATSVPAAALAIGSALWAKFGIFTLCLLSSARGAFIAQVLALPLRPAMNTAGHEHVHLLQRQRKKSTGVDILGVYGEVDLSKAYTAVAKINNILSFGYLGYLFQYAEIQARLHTIVAQGYRDHWKRLPTTKHELWAGLISMGLNAPKAIHDEVKVSSEQGVEVFLARGAKAAFQRAARKNLSTEIAELNALNESLMTRETKEKYWRDLVPVLYGHLLELYGDPKGRQKLCATADVFPPQAIL